MNPNCIYEVKTYWGYFRLDEGAYEDYLKGKLWITWVPREHSQAKITAAPPIHVSDEAVALYNKAEKLGVWELLQTAFPYEAFALTFKRRMSDVEIYEMNLSVRASNGLMRAGAKTLGKVAELVALPNGLRSIQRQQEHGGLQPAAVPDPCRPLRMGSGCVVQSARNDYPEKEYRHVLFG